MYWCDVSGDGWVDSDELYGMSDGGDELDAGDRYGVDSSNELL